jgi:hypothetical protein
MLHDAVSVERIRSRGTENPADVTLLLLTHAVAEEDTA